MEGDYGWFSNGFHAAGKVLVEPCYNYPDANCDCFGHQDDALGVCAGPCLFSSQDALGCEMLQSCSNTVVSVPGEDFDFLHGTYEIRIAANCANNATLFSGTIVGDPYSSSQLMLQVENWDASHSTAIEWHQNYNMTGMHTDGDQIFSEVMYVHGLVLPDGWNANVPTPMEVRLAAKGGYYEGDYGLYNLGQFDASGKILILPCDDLDEDGICDSVDDCVGTYDSCGVCNGPGAIYSCGCSEILAGECNCQGEVLDAIGVCGGDCISDVDQNGVCDDAETYGCMTQNACNFDPNATRDEGCDHCSCREREARNVLSVENTPAVTPGLNVYRIYAHIVQTDERVLSVFGSPTQPMTFSAPQGVYNSPNNSTWSAFGISTALLEMFPELADDSYGTVGFTEHSSSGYDNGEELAPELIGTSFHVQSLFAVNGLSDMTTSGSEGWYIPEELTPPVSEGNRILIAQISTWGALSGGLNVMFTNNQGEVWSERYEIDGAGIIGLGFGDSQCGCTNSSSSNYDSTASYDDASCIPDVMGCTNEDACNYNPLASVDDGTCFNQPAHWCDCNGNQLDALGVCGGDCDADVDADGICDDLDDCVGVYDECGVCNGMGIPIGICNCDGFIDFDGDGVCDNDEVYGCSDIDACNFDATVTEDDGSCEFCSCEPDESNFKLRIEQSSASIEGLTRYRFFIETNHHQDEVVAVYGTGASPLVLEAPEGLFNSIYAQSWNASDQNPALLGFFPELVDDSYATIQLEGPASMSYLSNPMDPVLVDDNGSVTEFFTEQGAQSLTTGTDGASWFVTPNSSNALPDALLDVFVMQLTSSGPISGTINVKVKASGLEDVELHFSFEGSGLFDSGVFHPCGCMDSTALNFDADATISDDDCTYPIHGCMNLEACNYNHQASQDDGSCAFEEDECGICGGAGEIFDCGCSDIPLGDCDCNGSQIDAVGVCGGNCTADVDGDGICDLDEIYGCANNLACNYDSAATEDDGTCDFCSCEPDVPGYSLRVEGSSSSIEGMTSYRVYVELNSDLERVLGIYGTASSPLRLEAPGGIFNSSYSQTWNAAGQNAMLFGAIPELVDNSFATILLDGPASLSSLSNAADPILIDDENGGVLKFFTTNDETILETGMDGASWLVPPDASNAYPNDMLDVLIMQITTTGTISGTLNVRVKNELDEEDEMRFSFNGTGSYQANSTHVCGCLEPTAINYDGGASISSDDCIVLGCVLSEACNFNPIATLDDGSCQFEEDDCGVCNGPGSVYECGCADIPLGDCDCNGNQLDALGVCGGDCDADADADGICDDVDDCVGAYDDCGVCNGPGSIYECGCADIPLGDCDCNGNHLDAVAECGGNCAFDLDLDGSCDGWQTCSNVNVNAPGEWFDFPHGIFEISVTSNCVEDPQGFAGTLVFDPTASPPIVMDIPGVATSASWSYEWHVDYNMTGWHTNDNQVFTRVLYIHDLVFPDGWDNDWPKSMELRLAYSNGWYEGDYGLFNWGQFDAGGKVLVHPCETDEDHDGICDNLDSCIGAYDDCGVCNGPGSIYECGCADIPLGDCDCNGNQLDALGVCGGDCDADNNANGLCDNSEVHGCMDISACNFDIHATFDSENCDYLDECGVCGGPGAVYECGCAPIPLGDCDCAGSQLDAIGNCGGTCASDYNYNGICDTEDVPGCTYPGAENFDSSATLDIGNCEFPNEFDCDDSDCIGDLSNDGFVGIDDILMMLSLYDTTCE